MNAQLQVGSTSPLGGQVFNLFRRRGSDLVCAVPIDRPVPSFLDGSWEHSCEADAATPVPGFAYRSACALASRYGFALFRTSRAHAPVGRKRLAIP